MTAPGGPGRLPRWRVAAALAVLAVLLCFGVLLAPVYVHNFQLRQYVEEITRNVENREKPDELLRTWVLQKADALGLPVKASNVQIKRSPEGVRIDIRYVVRVDLPVYSVDLHLRPGAGSR